MQMPGLSLDAFEPNVYLQTLAALAAVYGVSPDEKAFLQRQAAGFDLDLDKALEAVPKPVVEIAAAASETTRRFIYRDFFMLAHTDGQVSDEKHAMLANLQTDLRIDPDAAAAIESWTNRFNALVVEADVLFGR